MAIRYYNTKPKDGIQLGGPLDYCSKCIEQKYNGSIKYGELEYKEIFKIYKNGVSHAICMDHFKELLGDYDLIKKDLLNKHESTKNECKCTSCNCKKEEVTEEVNEITEEVNEITEEKEEVAKEKTTKKKNSKKNGDK